MPEWNLVTRSELKHMPRRFRARLTAWLLLATGLVVQIGCSGIASDQLTSQLMQERPILLPEDSEAAEVAKQEIDGASTTATAEGTEHVNAAVDQARKATKTAAIKSEPANPPFRFTTDVPELIATVPAEKGLVNSTARITKVSSSKFLKPLATTPTNDFQPIVDEQVAIAASTEPRENSIVLTSATAPLPRAKTGATGSGHLITVPLPEVEITPVDRVVSVADQQTRFGAGLKPSELNRVMPSDDWSTDRLAAASIDLTHLEMPVSPTEATTTRKNAAPEPLTSTQHLARSIELLKQQRLESTAPEDSLLVSVRLLELLQRKLNSISRHDSPMSNDELAYWQQQVDALALTLETQPITTEGTTEQQEHQLTFAAIERLEQATDHLRSMAGLRVRGGQLCSRISGFGQYQLLDSTTFAPGDQALVYVEVENFESQPSETSDSAEPNQWTTRLNASYAIYDSSGSVVQQRQYPLIEDIARKRRRDFYVHLPLTVGDLDAGQYELQVIIEDANRSTSATLPVVKFSVKSRNANVDSVAR